MGKIDSGKVLVTGASGYIGAWTAKYALDAGYITIATVRVSCFRSPLSELAPDHAEQSEDKGNYLKKQYGNNPKFDYVIVKDIAQPDAFDQCFKTHSDIDAVLHTASPFHFQADDPQELIKRALLSLTCLLKEKD